MTLERILILSLKSSPCKQQKTSRKKTRLKDLDNVVLFFLVGKKFHIFSHKNRFGPEDQ